MNEIDGSTTESVEARLRRAYADLAPSPGFDEGLEASLAETAQGAARSHRWVLPAAVAAAVAVAAVLFWVPREGTVVFEDDPTPGGAPLLDEAKVDAERAANRKAYEASVAGLHTGEWVVISGGRVVAKGATMEDVAGAAPEALHRFVFEVGKEGDREEFVSGWYGPRFAGPALAAALRTDWTPGTHSGTTLTREGGRSLGPVGVPPFPRVPMHVNPPDGDPGRPSHGPLDVFLGTVGPPLMLMPWDFLSRGLARFEIPGTMKVYGGDCRMATALVSIPEIGAKALVVASCPAFPRESLVEMARHRDAFWNWGWQLAQQVSKGREGKWVVFAADRVVGEGDSLEAALRAARGKPDGYYHRYVVKLPREGPLEIDATDMKDERRAWLNGVEVSATAVGAGTLVVSREAAAAIGLENAEEGRDVRLRLGSWKWPARAGYAWLTKDRGSPMSGSGAAVLVVYDAPPEPEPVPVPVAPVVTGFSPAGPLTDGMLTATADPKYPGTIVVLFGPPKPGEIIDRLEGQGHLGEMFQVLRMVPGTGSVPVGISRMDVRADRVVMTPARLPLEDGQYSVVVNFPEPAFHSFTVGPKDEVPPEVVLVTPAMGATNIPTTARSAEVVIRFTESVDPASVNATSVRVEGGGVPIAPAPGYPTVRIGLPAKGFEVVWLAEGDGLPPSSRVRAVVEGVRDRAGNALEKPFAWEFTTAGPTPPPR